MSRYSMPSLVAKKLRHTSCIVKNTECFGCPNRKTIIQSCITKEFPGEVWPHSIILLDLSLMWKNGTLDSLHTLGQLRLFPDGFP